MCLVERLGSAGSLRHLTFWNLPIVPGWLEQVALALPNLQSLSVSAISSHDTAEGTTFSAELSKALPHRLRYLQCTPEGLVIENSASSQPLFASTLKVLHLRTLGSSQPADARRSTSLTAALAEQAKQLEILCLEDWLDSKGLVNVARLKNLTYLDVNIHSSCIQQYGQVLRALPKLRAVGLSGRRLGAAMTVMNARKVGSSAVAKCWSLSVLSLRTRLKSSTSPHRIWLANGMRLAEWHISAD